MSRRLGFLVIMVVGYLTVNAQSIKVISPSKGLDSSYYHLLEINENEYWAGGKNGVLTRIDTLGNCHPIQYPSLGLKILKIVKTDNIIYFSTDNGIIYKYDIKENAFTYKKFDAFANKAFYDMIVLDNGQLMVVGGSTAIVRSNKKFPMGFIATVTPDLEKINIVWSNYRKFVWSIIQLPNGSILASTFNGLNTKILESSDQGSKWKKKKKIKGLVHEITQIDDTLWYCGARSFYFFDYFWKNGILGIVGEKKYKLKDRACQWSMCKINNKIATINTKGEIILTNPNTKEIEIITMPYPSALYDIEQISRDKYLVVGNGKGIYIVDFSN